MSLVPIVYTSLVLFFGLLIIVIAISYLTFKTKSKVNPVIQEEITNQQKKMIILRQNQYAAYQLHDQQQSKIITRPTYAYQNSNHIVQNLQSEYFQNLSPERSQSYYPEHRQNEVMNYTPGHNHTKVNTQIRNRRTNNRIEIMNDSSNFSHNKNVYMNNRSTPRHNPNLDDHNFLDFYSDSPETELSNITAAQRKAV